MYLSADEPAHVAVFRVDTDGRLRVLFPREPWGDTFVRDQRDARGERPPRWPLVHGGRRPGRRLPASRWRRPNRFDFDDITRGDYWDYRLIDGGRIQGDPYVLLIDLAERITRGATTTTTSPPITWTGTTTIPASSATTAMPTPATTSGIRTSAPAAGSAWRSTTIPR